MPILITICARGGSKGIPGKNIKPLNGKPLIAYTIEAAKKFRDRYKDVDIALSTDSDEIKNIAGEYSLHTNYKRSEVLAGDAIGKVAAISDVLLFYETENNKKYDYILDMDVTSPLRNLMDLTEAYNIIEKSKDALNLFSVNKASRNPYFNMVEQKENGFYNLVKTAETVLSRQTAPAVYDMNASFYLYRRSFFKKNRISPVTEKSLIYVMPHICFDLDHIIDFEFLSYLLVNGKLDFEL